ncbi:hypothetical protein [Pygmaiobacter massiliensis]|uniref:hypothetical protein n=1 Tax=Pygmaiobacter massiliensis TaxID=1917873 RepID=UPI000C7DEF6A|nr:hypothetical protein [Pygmaiobacter massiliensis]
MLKKTLINIFKALSVLLAIIALECAGFYFAPKATQIVLTVVCVLYFVGLLAFGAYMSALASKEDT